MLARWRRASAAVFRLTAPTLVLWPAAAVVLVAPVHAQENARARNAGAVINATADPLLSTYRYRSIGPAVMGGRVDDIAVAPSDPHVIYAGFATGGVFKSVNNGTTFTPIFDTYGSGSVGDIAVDPRDADVVYVGTGEANNRQSSSFGDGLYKSTDGGKTFARVGLAGTQSIARIVIDPRHPDVVYVAAPGHLFGPNEERGLYKTTDAGRTWARVAYVDAYTGFTDVVLDPTDPDVVYAASYQRVRTSCCYNGGGPGSALWKSTDAGATWTRLTHGLPAGPLGRIAIDVSRSDSRVVYAQVEAGSSVLVLPGTGADSAARHELRPAPDSAGVYHWSAGGDAARYWCDNGAAKPAIGSGGPSSVPAGVRPVLDPSQGGLYRSDDGGGTWTLENNCDERPLYFSQVRVDPNDPNTVYISGGSLARSTDGGRTLVHVPIEHSDSHALWIDPADSKHLINGNDGGINISYDGGRTWDFVATLATAQAYSVAADFDRPYHIYVGLQDNGTWRGPSSKRGRNGIENADWFKLPCVGDGYITAVSRTRSDIAYCEGQDGAIERVELASGRAVGIRPVSGASPRVADPPPACDDGRDPNNPRLLRPRGPSNVTNASPHDIYRFNWSTPFILSPQHPDAILLGGNRLFRSTDRGDHWTASADLTKRIDRCLTVTMGVRGDAPQIAKNDGIEWYSTIVSVAQSPVNGAVIWAGTDDGNLQVSRDTGRTFVEVAPNLPGLPSDNRYWVAGIDASHADQGTAYVAVDGHRSDDMHPYVFVTHDFGRTFRRIVDGLPDFGNVRVVREDPKNPSLLFAGTEVGVFASLDAGAHWTRFMNGLPVVRTDDILVHPRDGDLIVGTHGRGVWIVDDITALEQLTPAVAARDVYLFQPRESVAWVNDLSNASPTYGARTFSGENAPAGPAIAYYLRTATSDSVRLSVVDAAGHVVGTASAPSGAGIHKLPWTRLAPAGVRRGPGRLPAAGRYTVRLTVGSRTFERPLRVLADRWFAPDRDSH